MSPEIWPAASPSHVPRSEQAEAGREQGQPEQGREREQSLCRNKAKVQLGRNIRCGAGNVEEGDQQNWLAWKMESLGLC